MVSFSLAGKVALVTGASRGLGASIVRAYAEAGADVALVARNTEGLEVIAEQVRGMGRRAAVISADLADASSAAEIIQGTIAALGKLDIVVNNAGISPIYKPSIEVTQDEWDAIFAVNVSAPFRVSQAAARAMIAAGNGGAIIQMASVAGMIATPRMIAYGAAKAALLQISRTLAVEWANKGIRVNAIAPGYIATDLTAGIMSVPRYFDGIRAATPLGRFGEPDEIAGIAVYLASAASSFATGQTFIVDGGISAQ